MFFALWRCDENTNQLFMQADGRRQSLFRMHSPVARLAGHRPKVGVRPIAPSPGARVPPQGEAHFGETLRSAEEAFTAELSKILGHFAERLSGQEDGKPETSRNSVVENLTDFVGRFRELNVRPNERLEQLVGQARRSPMRPPPAPGRQRSRLDRACAAALLVLVVKGRSAVVSLAGQAGDLRREEEFPAGHLAGLFFARRSPKENRQRGGAAE